MVRMRVVANSWMTSWSPPVPVARDLGPDIGTRKTLVADRAAPGFWRHDDTVE
ncbi:hypothetical protein [Rhodococcoides corynebacterioides]|uniref:hypothetical protein n=1 Tax=Rhodococcoides corynebacterioides TaxID=53972 RepID=UPI000A8AC592|nr:hypothetical protein [Rhodococcus corynebacterioides]